MLYRRVQTGLSFDVLQIGRTEENTILKPQSEKWVGNMNEGKAIKENGADMIRRRTRNDADSNGVK
jgi:hypothetical protein